MAVVCAVLSAYDPRRERESAEDSGRYSVRAYGSPLSLSFEERRGRVRIIQSK
jgi:hypothetical protein